MASLNQKKDADRPRQQPLVTYSGRTNILQTTLVRLVALSVIAAIFAGVSSVSAEEEDSGGDPILPDYSRTEFSSPLMSNMYADIIAASILQNNRLLPDDTFESNYISNPRNPTQLDKVNVIEDTSDAPTQNEYLFLNNTKIPLAVWNDDLTGSKLNAEVSYDETLPNPIDADSIFSSYVGDLEIYLERLGGIGRSPFLGFQHICAPSNSESVSGCLVLSTVAQSTSRSVDREETSKSGNTDPTTAQFSAASQPTGESTFPHLGGGVIYLSPVGWQAYPNVELLGCDFSGPLCLPATVTSATIDETSVIDPTPALGSSEIVSALDFTTVPEAAPFPDFQFAPIGPAVPEGSTLTLMLLGFGGIALALARRAA
jgi:hypothetical protein